MSCLNVWFWVPWVLPVIKRPLSEKASQRQKEMFLRSVAHNLNQVFYPRDKKGVQYHGPLTVEAIVEFLLSARNPVYHLRSKNDLLELQARHNGKVVVGYFPDILAKDNIVGRRTFR